MGDDRALPRRAVRGDEARRGARRAGATKGRSTSSRPGSGVEHRVIPWDDVSADEGTGIVHIAPGCGGEDFELSRTLDLPVLMPVDESGRFYDDYGWLHGLSTVEAAEQIIGNLEEKGRLVEAGLYEHRYPECWRCHTPLIFRIADDWFISVDELRPADDRRERHRRVGARLLPEAHGGLAAEHGRLEHLAPPLLRAAAAVLSVRLRAPQRHRVEGRARRACTRRHGPARGAAPPVDRPRTDRVREMRCASRPHRRGRRRLARRGHRPVLDARLAERRARARGLRDRSGEGPHARRPPRPRVLGAVVPRRPRVGDARADPPVVLLAALHVGRARRPRAVQAHPRLREDVRRDRPRDARLVGEHDRGERRAHADGRGRHALAVRRAAAEPGPLVRVRPCARDQAPAADVLELREVPRRLREHRRVRAVVVRARADRGPSPARPLARRAHEAARARSGSGVRGAALRRRHARVRGLRRRRVELVHPPLAPPFLRLRRSRVSHALVRARAVAARHRAGDAVPRRPPLAEPRARRSRVGAPRRLARGGRRRHCAARRHRERTPHRRARPPGARHVEPQAPPAAAASGRRGRDIEPRRRDRRGVAREGGRVRRGRGVGAAREAEPPEARAEARRRAARRQRRACSAASSRSSTAGGSRSTAMCSSPTRSSSSASDARAGRSRARAA